MNFIDEFKERKSIVSFLFSKYQVVDPESRNDYDLFHDFEVVMVNVQSNTGIKMTIDTRVTNSPDGYEYVNWGSISSTIKQYIQKNSNESDDYSSLKLHVRLRAPKRIYNILNYNKLSEYSFFDINFHIEGRVIMVSTSAVEKSVPVAYSDPAAIWDQTIQQYINSWRSSGSSMKWDTIISKYINLWKNSPIKDTGIL